MIEVEKKFQPTETQLQALLVEAEFVGEKFYSDFLYDYPDRRLFKQGFRLRNRNGNFELKILRPDFEGGTSSAEEIEDETGILEKLGFGKDSNLAEIVSREMNILASWETKRKKYKKGQFNIDVDETSFGYNVCEIEVMVENSSEAEEASTNIMTLAQEFGFSLTKLPSKLKEYFRVMKPDFYKEFYQ
ncbi:MAG: CYTH domain-containing protein [Candidatus Paceibacterota bacterium]|jgi:predicted adenylyl cyclase CyaB